MASVSRRGIQWPMSTRRQREKVSTRAPVREEKKGCLLSTSTATRGVLRLDPPRAGERHWMGLHGAVEVASKEDHLESKRIQWERQPPSRVGAATTLSAEFSRCDARTGMPMGRLGEICATARLQQDICRREETSEYLK